MSYYSDVKLKVSRKTTINLSKSCVHASIRIEDLPNIKLQIYSYFIYLSPSDVFFCRFAGFYITIYIIFVKIIFVYNNII
jgi:hypothetical protein